MRFGVKKRGVSELKRSLSFPDILFVIYPINV